MFRETLSTTSPTQQAEHVEVTLSLDNEGAVAGMSRENFLEKVRNDVAMALEANPSPENPKTKDEVSNTKFETRSPKPETRTPEPENVNTNQETQNTKHKNIHHTP